MKRILSLLLLLTIAVLSFTACSEDLINDALDAAIEAGVKVLMLPCFVDSTSIFIVEKNK